MVKRRHESDGGRAPASGGAPPAATESTARPRRERATSAIDDIFGKLGEAKAKAGAAPSTLAAAGDDKGSKPAKRRRVKGEPVPERAAPSAFAPPDRAERAGWVDDGLGGVHDKDGWTGRRTEEGMRIFKTRLLQPTKKKVSGGTPLCPFDCDCCYI